MKEADTGVKSWSNIPEAFGQNKRHNLRIKRKKGAERRKWLQLMTFGICYRMIKQ